MKKASNIAQFLKPKNLWGKCRHININNISVISVVKRDNFAPQLSNCGLRHAILNKTVKYIKQVTETENERKKGISQGIKRGLSKL